MKNKAKPRFSLTLFAILVFSITSLILAYSALAGEIDPIFTLLNQTVTTDLSFAQTATATASGTALANNDRVCIGAITITPAVTSTYSSVRDTKVECPTYGCAPRDTTAGATGTLNTQLVTQATYNTIVSTYRSCVYTGTGAPANAYAPNIVYMNYARGDYLEDVRGSAATRNGVQCYGTSTATVNGASIGTIDFTGGSQVFTPSNIGTYNLSASYSVSGCGVMVRTYETDGPTYDCYLRGTATGSGSAPSTITINVVRGPVVNITAATIASTIPAGSSGSFSFTVRNDGDMNMTINPAAITFTGGGMTVSTITPSIAVTLAPGANQTFSGTISAPSGFTQANYPNGVTVSITVPYTSPDPVVGACGASLPGAAPTFPVGTVTPQPPSELTMSMIIDPSGIIRDKWHNVSINVTITRDGIQSVGGTLGSKNITIERWNGTEWLCAPGWSTYTNCMKDFSFTYYPSGQETTAYANMTEPVYYTPFGEDWPVGVYSVRIAVKDDLRSQYTGTNVVVRLDRYFVIYTLSLCER